MAESAAEKRSRTDSTCITLGGGDNARSAPEVSVMPFKSEAQRRYFEANKAKLEKQGVDVKEWEASSRGLKLPERAPARKPSKKKQ